MTVAFHLANALFLISYAVGDILWLRLITVLATASLMLSFVLAPSPPLAAIVRGTARVQLGEQAIEIADGTFIGELGFLTGKPPGADVEATTQLRVLRWQVEKLRDLLDDNPELRATMQQVLGADLAAKLRR